MMIVRGIMLPQGGELHAEFRRQLRVAELEGYVDCVEEGTSNGHPYEAYQLTEKGLLVAAAIVGRTDRPC